MPPLRESYQAVGLQAFEEMQPEYNLIAGGWGGVRSTLPVGSCCALPSAMSETQLRRRLRLCIYPPPACHPVQTLSTVTEGLAAASAASASSLPFWVSWTLEDGDGRALLRSGESLQARGAAALFLLFLSLLLLHSRLVHLRSSQTVMQRCALMTDCRTPWRRWPSCRDWTGCWSTAARPPRWLPPCRCSKQRRRRACGSAATPTPSGQLPLVGSG